MWGGKMIGEGIHGCINYQPRLNCENEKKTTQNEVSKLMKTTEAIKEFTKNEEVRDIVASSKSSKSAPLGKEGHREYMLLQNRKCKPTPHISKSNFGKCSLKKGYTKNPKQYSLLIGRYGGVSLYSIIDNILKGWEKLHKNRVFVSKYLGLMGKMGPVFKGLYYFNISGCIHHDIKDDNVVYLDKSPTGDLRKGMRYIDFGRSVMVPEDIMHMKKECRAMFDSDGFHPPYPIEYTYCCSNKKELRQELKNYKNRTYYENIKKIHVDLLQTCSSNEDFDRKVENIIKEYIKKKPTDNELMKIFMKIDVYSLGMACVYEISRITDIEDNIAMSVIFKTSSGKFREFIKLLGKMMNLDYRKRLDSKQAYTEFRKIFQTRKTQRKLSK
jgi:serine/threonine protein kinase